MWGGGREKKGKEKRNQKGVHLSHLLIYGAISLCMNNKQLPLGKGIMGYGLSCCWCIALGISQPTHTWSRLFLDTSITNQRMIFDRVTHSMYSRFVHFASHPYELCCSLSRHGNNPSNKWSIVLLIPVWVAARWAWLFYVLNREGTSASLAKLLTYSFL